MNHPLLLALLTVGGLYLGKLWRDDFRAAKSGLTHANALPGATAAPTRAVLIAIAGALVILAIETAGEIALGVTNEQAQITWLFALCSILSAPIVEEVIFRGWLVIENRGRMTLWGSAIAASLLFAAAHPFLWRSNDDGFAFTFGTKGWFSTGVVFAMSLWFYVARFAQWNPHRSLLPCFAAHAVKNVGVVAVKTATGFMGGIW